MVEEARRGWGLVETVIAVLVAAVMAIPLFSLFIGTRSDTCKAVNYLRAIELANEGIDWIAATPLTAKTLARLQANTGSLVDGAGTSVPYRLGTNSKWAADLPKQVSYPGQYGRCWFYRTITITPVAQGASDHRSYLYQATVTVAWNEEHPPQNLQTPDRSKLVQLSTLVCDERRGY